MINSSLWPRGIETQRVKAPVVLLREQASILGQITKNLVQGEVYVDNRGNDSFLYRFSIISPSLSNYRYQLLTIWHNVSLYPVEIEVEEAIRDEIQGDVKIVQQDQYDVCILAETEEEFEEALRAIFGAEKTVRVITALLSQADPAWKAKGDWPPPEEPEPPPFDKEIPF